MHLPSKLTVSCQTLTGREKGRGREREGEREGRREGGRGRTRGAAAWDLHVELDSVHAQDGVSHVTQHVAAGRHPHEGW